MTINDITTVKLSYYLQFQREIPQELLEQTHDWLSNSTTNFTSLIIKHLYLGINSENYVNQYEKTYSYLNPTLKQIFRDMYTEEEINIITGYIALWQNGKENFSAELKPKIEVLLVYNGDKEDIIYYMNELKYLYVRDLIAVKDTDETRLFTLLNELTTYASSEIPNKIAEYLYYNEN